jgi:hypothetical protein
MSVAVQALDGVDRVIMKCRTDAITQVEQIMCLEKALRDARSINTATPDWAGTKSAPSVEGAVAGSAAGASGLGAEQIPLYGVDAKRAREIRSAKEVSQVTDFAYTQSGRLILVLSNGQVWKQRSGDVQTVKLQEGDTPAVAVRRGAISGYRMDFIDLNRIIIVSRLK